MRGNSFFSSSLFCLLLISTTNAQSVFQPKLPDTAQTRDYTATFGEDSDYVINSPSFTDHGEGTITDQVTGLMWQKTDGGEMTFENAGSYCGNLSLAGYTDWRLPTSRELFSIFHYDKFNPALDTNYFTKTSAEYWWSKDTRVDDAARVWVTNAGGGIGPHPKAETKSAGGTKLFHVRAVRNVQPITLPTEHLADNGDGTITDRYTNLVWQKIQPANAMTWEEALSFCENLSLAGKTDWRLPNIKELQALNSAILVKPSVDKTFFPNIVTSRYWSSTSQLNTPTRAWYINFEYGIVTYEDKTSSLNVLAVRGGLESSKTIAEVKLSGGVFEMGDHHNYVDPQHPSDEKPLHQVKINPIYMATTETTNQQYLTYLSSALAAGRIEVRNGVVYAVGGNDIYCFTYQYANYSSIGYDGKTFSIIDFRANHPMVGVMWFGAAAYCNWLSTQNGLDECYDLKTWSCDFTKNGYRLPTEAEWEYTGRGGQYNPYYIFPWGDEADNARANWPSSGDPYETGTLPYTTPAGFYNGKLHTKAEFNWPSSQQNYQTANGANAFGLYDMSGNVWELVNDWYGQNYYSLSPFDNPKGPDTGFIMPDGKPYRGMRGGNWYNGEWGHSRVANRNPSYYRGPQDPNHPWYHVGFRVARYDFGNPTGVDETEESFPKKFELYQNYPNPFNPTTMIRFSLPAADRVTLRVYNTLGQEVATLIDGMLAAGNHDAVFNGYSLSSGVYFYKLQYDGKILTRKMLLMR